MAGFGVAAWNRLRALGVGLWKNRTKFAGYAGVIGGAAQAAQGQGWYTLLLGCTVAAIGHYNDGHMGPT